MSNSNKIIGIAKRLSIAPQSMHKQIVTELVDALDEESPAPNQRVKQAFENLFASRADAAIATLRDALTWPEVKASPHAVARICRQLRALRNAS